MADPLESSRLLANDDLQEQAPIHDPSKPLPPPPPPVAAAAKPAAEWIAEGLPVATVGEPRRREQWDSGIFACLGRNDEFCSSDLEVCLLGSIAPCVLYGSNIERLGSDPRSFAPSCLPYAGLYLLGNSCFGGNWIAPWFSYPSRTAIRRSFSLEGSCETVARSFGLGSSCMDDEATRERLETACDFATHLLCHPCALCQEGRELRRRVPHPGFNRSLMVMVPPSEESMVRGCI